jgi:hypothetical protein
MEKLINESKTVATNMEKFGGSFSKNLGKALSCADIENIKKIKNTWPELWNTFLNWNN